MDDRPSGGREAPVDRTRRTGRLVRRRPSRGTTLWGTTVRYHWTSPAGTCELPLPCGSADLGRVHHQRMVVRRTAGRHQVTGPSCSCGQRRASGSDLRVLVVDDHPMVRTALSEVLSDEDGVTVVGECEDGSQVVEAVTRL